MLHGRSVHRELVHVPLVLRGPGLPGGLRVQGDASLVDLAPTVLALLGLSAPEGLEGRDLAKAWRDPERWTRERPVFAEADFWMAMEPGQRRRGVQRGRFVLLSDEPEGERRLYDLELDPKRTRDRSAELPEVLEALWGELERFEAGGRGAAEDIGLSPQERAELERLGYL